VTSTTSRGRAAEAAGVTFLRARGYRVLARNVRTRGGELDAVAWDGTDLCFVEIRSRRPGACGLPEETVDHRKQRRLVRAARAFLVRFPGDPACRFDVLAVDRQGSGYTFRLYKDAFRADA
jgi:putative endonuclease